jgi:hypothetical protein
MGLDMDSKRRLSNVNTVVSPNLLENKPSLLFPLSFTHALKVLKMGPDMDSKRRLPNVNTVVSPNILENKPSHLNLIVQRSERHEPKFPQDRMKVMKIIQTQVM